MAGKDDSSEEHSSMPVNIKFNEDQIRPVKTHTSADASGVDLNQGIVFGRTLSMARDGSKARSFDKFRRRGSQARSMTRDEEDDSEVTPTDYAFKQTFHGWQLWYLAYQSIGVIYGDIGTSPLYVFSSIFTSAPSNDDLVGALSLILYSLLVMVTIKYIIIVLRADNSGEGGTFSTYSLIGRYAEITTVDPKEKSLRQIERFPDEEMPKFNLKFRQALEGSHFARTLLKTVAVLAVCAVIADGVLTPAQSVLSAVAGLNIVTPGITNAQVVGATVGILGALFGFQFCGVNRIAPAFAPIIMIWLLAIAGVGCYNIAHYDGSVARAWSPYFAFQYLIRNGKNGWVSLGAVLLSFTGLEALFADLGAFSQRAIQISWFCWAFPCLVLAYIGQAAYISVNPDAYANPVFLTAPPGWTIPLLVLAVLAAIIASEATIVAAFNLISQLNKLSYLPTIAVIHKSKTHFNQIYVPAVNWLLMVATILVAAIANNPTTLSYAYGACVALVTTLDTVMVTLVALLVWRLPWYIIALPFLAIISLDGAFLSSALTKVPDGAWFTLTLAGVLACCFLLWNHGKLQQWQAESHDRKPLSTFIAQHNGKLELVNYNNEVINQHKGLGIYFDKVGDKTPIVFSAAVERLVLVPEVTCFLCLRALERPSVPPSERFFVSRMKLPNTYRILVRYGYMDEVISNDLAAIVYNQLRRYIMTKHIDRSAPALAEARQQDGEKADESREDTVAQELAFLDAAYEHRVTYYLGKEDLEIKPGSNIFRRFILSIFLFVRHNTRQKMANLKLDRRKQVEIGFVKAF